MELNFFHTTTRCCRFLVFVEVELLPFISVDDDWQQAKATLRLLPANLQVVVDDSSECRPRTYFATKADRFDCWLCLPVVNTEALFSLSNQDCPLINRVST